MSLGKFFLKMEGKLNDETSGDSPTPRSRQEFLQSAIEHYRRNFRSSYGYMEDRYGGAEPLEYVAGCWFANGINNGGEVGMYSTDDTIRHFQTFFYQQGRRYSNGQPEEELPVDIETAGEPEGVVARSYYPELTECTRSTHDTVGRQTRSTQQRTEPSGSRYVLPVYYYDVVTGRLCSTTSEEEGGVSGVRGQREDSFDQSEDPW